MNEPIIVHGGWFGDYFFIWGEQKPKSRYDQIVNFQYPFLYDPFELKLALFRHDKLSFYGTFIEIEKAVIDVPLVNRTFQSLAGEATIYQAQEQMKNYSFPIQGIRFSTEEVVDYWLVFEQWKKENDLLIAPDLLFWLDLFKEVREQIYLGHFAPTSFAKWQLRPFPFESWVEVVPPSSVQLRTSSSFVKREQEELTIRKQIQLAVDNLADTAIRFLMKEDQVSSYYQSWKEALSPKWGQLVDTLIENKQLEPTISTKSLQEQMGTIERPPFKSGIILKEPTDIHSAWQVHLCVVDRKQPNLIVEMEALSLGEHPWISNPIPLLKQDLQELKKKIPLLTELSLASPSIPIEAEQAYALYTEYDQDVEDIGFQLIVPSSLQQKKSLKVELQFDSQIGQKSNSDPFVDWQSLAQFSFEVAIGDVTLTEQEFKQYVHNEDPFIYTNGQWIAWDRSLAKKLRTYLDQVSKNSSYLDAWLLSEQKERLPDDLSDIDFEVNWDKRMTETLIQLYQQKPKNIELPSTFHGSLRSYQLEGASWLFQLRRAGFGGCLADDMGLGKSIQTIVYLLYVLEQNEKDKQKKRPFLLICPTSLIYNWIKECETFAPSLKIFTHHGSARLEDDSSNWEQYDLIITSYQMAVRDQVLLSQYEWNSLILDEAQHIKNIETKQRRTMKSIQAKHRIALTGTPIENKLRELWSLMDVLIPGYLGNHQRFQRNYIQPIEKNRDEKKLKQLQHLIFPFILRRKKSDEHLQLGLPEKSEKVHQVPLSVEQAILYQMIVDQLIGKLDEINSFERRALILKSLTKLKQICNHPAHFLKDRNYQEHDSEKWNHFISLVKEIANKKEKVLIFTQYKEMGMIMSDALNELFNQEIPFLHGSLSRAKRQDAIKYFQENEEVPAFILSLKAGGVGLNLTAATHVIHYDRWWNPAVENQATDRAFRIGQTSDVTVHKFITKGTLEERIDKLIMQKQGLAEQILSVSEQRVTELTNDEITELIQLTTN
ncbi:helicase SNF2 [Alkalihalobacillus alcalophilus ATCC 27647 = CGMCC 1.3604]|uniref:Helicase SNF2 n=1 Tax=Alkalihalobacillus alcalophilus ATCC 27647 = CGMCC 1.3604 TaxID=1218173 RepID=A0A094YV26_ALKAL|nr:DEAD/DEAH box helicase [Alkalihalobacillus alcalophilus]KGA97367.1 helicase SNF2 [Alkalihalobacillus alcalophilus ATCC 27647 = CGMCC 1.3604]MED1562089.1 DEAD/DEAH box helicase [Alkalihalobacillus alcalophilus]THG89490.1 helicase SNF2 [Alkalihalobacillus alcalophilus ATCC 27647 = CGMCC 1.3604]